MAKVRPFRGLRFDAARVPLSRALCPPYDVIDAALALELRRRPINAVAVELPAGEGTAKYAGAARVWRRWLREGVLTRDETPCFYVCQERFQFQGRALKRVGFFGVLGASSQDSRFVLPHERTLPKPKKDRFELLKAARVNTSPIFALFGDFSGRARGLLENATKKKPLASARPERGSGYRLWRVDEPVLVAGLSRILETQKILIADGHHRFEVARAFWRKFSAPGADGVLCYFCPREDKGLMVLPTHRVVSRGLLNRRALDDCEWIGCSSLSDLLKRLNRWGNPYAFGLYDQCFQLGLPRRKRSCGSGLSVEWVEERLLLPHDRGEAAYTPDARKALAQARAGGKIAVFVKPAGADQIWKAVKAVGLLPPKSTYFYPKVPTGLVFRELSR